MEGTGTFHAAVRAASRNRFAGANPPRVAAGTLGTPEASQELDREVTIAAFRTGSLEGCEDLLDPANRAWIMELPQGSGKKVLQLFSQVLLQAVATPPAGRAAFLIVALRRFTTEAWKSDCRVLALKVTPHWELASLRLPDDIDGMRTWYTTTYQKHADAMEELRRRREDPGLHPGREWRAGRGAERAAEAAKTPGQVMYHPGYAVPKGTARRGYGSDVRTGELHPHPGDADDLWPSVFAGYRDAPARFNSGGCRANDGSHWFMPLHRRLDLDRVLELMDRAESFTNVRPSGEGGGDNKKPR